MPIYAYKCASCGHAKDVLQRMSDDPLSICPACGQATFQKQLTAAGFQLKGSGWYVTDFRGGNSTAAPAAPTTPGAEAAASGGDSTAPAAAAPAPTPAAGTAPAPAAGTAKGASTPSSSST